MGFLQRRPQSFSPASLAVTAAGLLGTTVPVTIQRNNPLSGLEIYVDMTCGATGPTFVTGTQAGLENITNIIRNIQLTYTDADGPHTAVNCSGAGLLALDGLESANLDSATLEALRLSKGASLANNLKLRLTYRLNFVRPRIDEPLAHRCLLPIHKLSTDPILTLTFESAANMFQSGVTLAGLVVTYRPIYNDMSDALYDAIQKAGGFIRGDVIESNNTLPLGNSAEVSLPLPTGLNGSILGVVFRQYLGGASLTQDVVDLTTTLGSEERWRLDVGNNTWLDWRWKQLRTENDRARCLNVVSQTSSPSFGGAVAANTAYQPADVCMLSFLDPDNDGAAYDLGSALDVSDVTKTWNVRGRPASVATNSSIIYFVTRRLFGDLSKWQRIQI